MTQMAKAIDQYLKKRGSPMAGHGASFVQAGIRNGVDPRLLVGIATIESGAGANMKLAYNPFNWGVHRGQTFGSWSEALNTVAKGLRKNYIAAGMTTPEEMVSKYAPGSDGNDEGNWASVVRSVMNQLGGGGVPGVKAGANPLAAAPTQAPAPAQAGFVAPTFDPAAFKQSFQSRILQGQALHGRDLSDLITGSFRTPPPPVAPGGAPPGTQAPGATAPSGLPMEMRGKKLVLPQAGSWKSTHVTDGLADRGFTHAEDIMGHPGTPVGSPVDGTIMRVGSAQGGHSIYLKAADGRVYWLGHIETNMTPGTKVRRGQVIAQISADHAAPHVHIDWSDSY